MTILQWRFNSCTQTMNMASVNTNSALASLKVTDLDLSVRSQNCLMAGNIIFVTELMNKTDEELLRLPNLGLKTLYEIRRVITELGLHPAHVRQRPTESNVAKNQADLMGAKYESKKEAQAVLDANAEFLEEELMYFVSLRGERNGRIAGVRCGLSGGGVRTLQETGDQFDLTRERVRQICARLAGLIRKKQLKTPLLRKALDFVIERIPGLADEIEAQLVTEGLTRNRFRLDGLAEAADLLLKEAPFVVTTIGASRFVTPIGMENLPRIVNQISRKSIEHWGVATAADIVDQIDRGQFFDILSEPIGEQVVINSLRTRNDFRWLDEQQGWFWLSSVPRNRVLNQIEKILSVVRRINVSELRSGVSRNYRMEGFTPPSRVLLELCRQMPGYIVEDSYVMANPPLAMEEILNGTEAVMAKVLIEHGPVLSREEFEKLCLENGMNRSTFYVYIGNSPIIERYARGVYGLRGAEVPPGLVESLKPQRQNQQRRVTDYGWKEGNCWILYHLSKAMIDSGVVHLPVAIHKYIQGKFTLKNQNGADVGILVASKGNSWGLGPFFRRRGGEPGDYLQIKFNLAKREATVIIDDEGFEDAQDTKE